MPGPARMLKFIGTVLQNLKTVFLSRVDSGHPECPSGRWAPAICRMRVSSRRSGHRARSCALEASGVLCGRSGCRGLSEPGGGDGWGAQGRSRASGRERGTSVWAGGRRVGPGPRGRAAPPGSGSALGCHRRPRWRRAGRHLAALPWPGGAGLPGAPRTARPSGWASAELPGCLGSKAGGGQAGSSAPRVPRRQQLLSAASWRSVTPCPFQPRGCTAASIRDRSQSTAPAEGGTPRVWALGDRWALARHTKGPCRADSSPSGPTGSVNRETGPHTRMPGRAPPGTVPRSPGPRGRAPVPAEK